MAVRRVAAPNWRGEQGFDHRPLPASTHHRVQVGKAKPSLDQAAVADKDLRGPRQRKIGQQIKIPSAGATAATLLEGIFTGVP